MRSACHASLKHIFPSNIASMPVRSTDWHVSGGCAGWCCAVLNPGNGWQNVRSALLYEDGWGGGRFSRPGSRFGSHTVHGQMGGGEVRALSTAGWLEFSPGKGWKRW